MSKFIPASPLWRRLQTNLWVPSGTMGSILSSLPDETVRWLFDITPKGAKISDTVRSMVVDCYHEEHEEAA